MGMDAFVAICKAALVVAADVGENRTVSEQVPAGAIDAAHWFWSAGIENNGLLDVIAPSERGCVPQLIRVTKWLDDVPTVVSKKPIPASSG
jgi:hypothetical protein